MNIRKQAELRYSDVTPKEVYLNRRRFLVASAAAIGALAAPHSAYAAPTKLNAIKAPALFNVTDKETPLSIIAGYNNFYEFGTGKRTLRTTPPSGMFPTRGRCASRELGLTSRRRWI
jgi:methionine sulfoxide reductase catalytic subunit